jgi:tetratricopeptide (TPR) repeat protein
MSTLHEHPTTEVRLGENPCLQIQVDLSAMLDGELDAASVRRVMVHSDVCPECHAFMSGIQAQLHAHREVVGAQRADGQFGLEGGSDDAATARARELHRLLVENRLQLSKIFYELGRGFVLMGVSPNFSRLVAREPVPIPDMCLRGRHLLDEVQRMTARKLQPGAGSNGQGQAGNGHALVVREWVRARDLFEHGNLGTPQQNLSKGQRLLCESLFLRPDYHEARIYLGHAYHVAGQHEIAQREFGIVLENATDVATRALALVNLGNVFLEQGEAERSIPYFRQIMELGLDAKQPVLFAACFNLALAHGHLERFDECRRWLASLHEMFPHKRRAVATELRNRTQFATALARHPQIVDELAAAFPAWFPLAKVVA